MSNDDRITLLKGQREALKGHINSLKTFLDSYNKDTDLITLQLRLQIILPLFNNLETICNELDSLDTSEESKSERFIIYDAYYQTMAIARSHLPTNENPQILSNTSLTRENSFNSVDTGSSNTKKRKFKLPQASVPTFSGNYNEWLSFKNSFISLINQDPDLTEFEKLHLLRTALRNDALKKIQILPIDEDTYKNAWKILLKAYNNKRLLTSHHLSMLINIEKQDKNCSKDLERLADEAQQHIQSLESLGVKVSEEIVVQLITEKLSKEILAKWEETLTRDEFPTLDKLIEFLYKWAASLSKSDKDKFSNYREQYNTPSKLRKLDNKPGARVLLTNNRKCMLCNEDYHPLFHCEKFRNLTVFDRIKKVKEFNMCINCLKNHGTNSCYFGNCKICNKAHNTLLHIPNNETLESEKSNHGQQA